MIPKNPQERKRWMIAIAIGLVVGVALSAFLPDQYNPAKLIADKMKGGVQ